MTVAFVILIVFIAFLVRATLGFGDALLAMPLLVMVAGIKIAAPLMALLALIIAFVVFYQNRSNVDYKIAIQLVLTSLAGVPFGLYYLQHINEQVINLVLGIIIILFSGYKLSGFTFQVKTPGVLVWFTGFVSGILGAAYNTNGPPVIILLSSKRWSPAIFRSTLQCYFFFSGIGVVAGHFLSGNVDKEVVIYFLYTLPALFIAFFIGERFYKKLNAGIFYTTVHVVLLVLGIVLIYKAFLIQA